MPVNFRFLSRPRASHYLDEKWGIKRSPKTLAKYASVGGGPKFCRFGKHGGVFYDPADLDAWVLKNMSEPIASTSKAAAEAAKAEAGTVA